MQKLCCVRTIQQPLPVWIIVTSLPTHISINSHPFLVGIVSTIDDPPEPPVPENDPSDIPESDLDISDDPILDFVNSQCHISEDLDQALQAYQAYQVPCPQDSTMISERKINHHSTYHVTQASQAKHGSLVDGVVLLDQM